MKTPRSPYALALGLTALLWAQGAQAQAQAQTQSTTAAAPTQTQTTTAQVTRRTSSADMGTPYLRVIAQDAPVHTGPGRSYRQIYFAERGQVFAVIERGRSGYWFHIELGDGTTGWIDGNAVFPYRRDNDGDRGFFARLWHGFSNAVLGPPAVIRPGGADVEVSFSVGVLDGEGLFLLRPAWIVDKYFAIEGFAGINARAQTDIFLGGVGWTLRLIPGARVGPYLNAGVGVAHTRPKVDNFADPDETLLAVNAGGGLEITFKKQITLRLDARNWTIFDPDKASNGQEYTSGLAIFF